MSCYFKHGRKIIEVIEIFVDRSIDRSQILKKNIPRSVFEHVSSETWKHVPCEMWSVIVSFHAEVIQLSKKIDLVIQKVAYFYVEIACVIWD